MSIGEIRLTAVLRQLTGNVQWTVHEQQQLPALEFASEGSVQLGYRLGVRTRKLTGQFLNIKDTAFKSLQSWYRAAGRTLPCLLIWDPTVNEAWFVRWGRDNNWLFDRSYVFKGIHSMPATWDEVGRGLKP